MSEAMSFRETGRQYLRAVRASDSTPFSHVWIGTGPDFTAKQDDGTVDRFCAWPDMEGLGGCIAQAPTEGACVERVVELWHSLVKHGFFWPDGRLHREAK